MPTERTLLITGGAGFIGSNFIRYWLRQYPSDRIVNVDALTYAGNPDNLTEIAETEAARYRFVQEDIGNGKAMRQLMNEEKPDTIVHFAAESHNSRGVTQPQTFFRTNVLGTQTLLQAAVESGTPRFHHISTCEVYGDLPLDADQAFTEQSPYRPRTPYNASKAGADLAVRAYHETYGLPVTISVCSNNYGPYQFPEKVIPHFTVRALRGEPLPLYKSSNFKREWLHVDDHCFAIERILREGRIGETYNVGSGEEADIETVADIVLETLGASPDLKTYVEDRPGHDRRYLLDSGKIRDELGWQPQKDFEEGVRETVAWYRDHPEWWQPLLERLSVEEENWHTSSS